MEKKVVDLAKAAGFYVDSLGGVWAGKEDGEVTEATLALAKDIVDQCIRTVALLGSDKDDPRSVAIREAVTELENAWGIEAPKGPEEELDITIQTGGDNISGDTFKKMMDAFAPKPQPSAK